ncbi:hypothetical protein NT6N_04620 [Oceaniferula spumae]|uniref:Uncharacterized protein n=1 Tax=Oceaniferula spumae TaxID=2979115 RepID=A0AAT9FHG5_9BACT
MINDLGDPSQTTEQSEYTRKVLPNFHLEGKKRHGDILNIC